MTISVATEITDTLAHWRNKECTRIFNGIATITTYDKEKDWEMQLTLPLMTEQPPRRLETAFHLNGISACYKMPGQLNHSDVEAYVLLLRHAHVRGEISAKVHTQKLGRIFNQLAQDNKDLQQLSFDKTDNKKLFDAILGATSGFNKEDIQYFLDGNYGYVALAEPEYKKLHNALINKFGINTLGWVPTIDTMRKIEAQVKDRPALPYRGSI